jgi:hypothetical protein
MKNRFFVFLFIINLGFSSVSDSSEIELFFEPGSPVENYDELVENLQEGDEVYFGNGESFFLEGYLGEGTKTKVFSIGEGKAIRIPLMGDDGYFLALADYVDAYDDLEMTEVPRVRVYKEESSVFYLQDPEMEDWHPRWEGITIAEYLIVEEIEEVANAGRLFEEWVSTGICDEACKEMFAGLEAFFLSTWRLAWLGDFHLGQLSWDGERWVLVDFAGNNDFYRDPMAATVLRQLQNFERMVLASVLDFDEIEAKIQLRRKEALCDVLLGGSLK